MRGDATTTTMLGVGIVSAVVLLLATMISGRGRKIGLNQRLMLLLLGLVLL
jgi:Na+-transporting methylmalonyl-CoA/oxaloacetate decarboxylase gamma subunit